MIDPTFTAYLRSEGEAFGALSSAFKLDLYRRHGAQIGEDAHLGRGSLLIADDLELGPGAYFGDDCRVEALSFRAGELVHFGHRSKIRCRRIELGQNAFFAEDIEIGGGGAMDPEAELIVGSHGFVGEHVHLNPCRRLEIGDEVVISRSAVVMTHSFAGSELTGYPNRFAATSIGDRAQIGIGATLFPGIEMGAGSILLSGSSLVSNIPEGRFFGGVPATDIKSAARTLSHEDFVTIAARQVTEFARQMSLRNLTVETIELEGELRVAISADGERHVLRFGATEFCDLEGDCVEEVRVFTKIETGAFEKQDSRLCAIDLQQPAIRGRSGPLSDAFREFLRKRGVRLHPRSWTYGGGWL